MPPFTTRLQEGWLQAMEHLPLALVPLVTALLATDNVQQVASFRGAHFGFKFGLPLGVIDIWQFVNVPDQSVSVGFPLPEALPLLVVALPLGIVVQAGLSAGYFGSLAAALETGEYAFVQAVRHYFVPFFLYTLIPVLVIAPLGLTAFAAGRAGPVLLLVLLPVFLIAAYLFYATPYLIVLRDIGLVDALKHSYELAVAGGPYFRFAIGYALFVLGVSIGATAIVVNLGLIGVLLGAVLGAPIGLTANAMTMRFVADLDDASPDLGTWDDSTAEPAPQP